MRTGLRVSVFLIWSALTGLSSDTRSPALAVIEKAAGCVGFYTEEGLRVAGARLGGFPHEGVLSPDGRLLYVTDNGVLWMTDEGDGGNTVSIIDVQAMKRVGVIDLGRFRRPHGIALDAAYGRLCVTTEKPSRLLVINAAARKVLRDYDIQGKSPHMVTLGSGGVWAFVSNSDTNAVAAVHLATGRVKLIPTGQRPQGSALAPGGSRLYVVNSNSGSISIIDTQRQAAVGTIPIGAGAGRIAVTPDGKSLVYNLQGDQGVGFADVADGKQVAFIPLGGRPLSLTMTRDGQRVFSSIQDQDRAFVISVSGRKILRTFQLPKGAGPDPVIPF